ncbi:response regulator [Dichelobacter nodosus]|uniref:Twitching motility regulator PilG n=1 Tax=Dichelobacter nodosus (strain VCS1703A) TaxID=246195 RepID=A5EXP4_DICNV|nr:response regulator [Dichelobacter nodosus]ABQ14071.1 twitching motility regulator PilG [Dichelobacter nodosus VCS1703A]AXM45874.1 response regulator [Dichelobacter nodosus]KNZ39040.1 chemotaxis protein CheY [Dichelobacter nodosus]TGA64673.1 response regulator [Dichelobacter nodosus]
MAEASQSVKILIVDDSGTIRKTAEAILGKEGFQVATAEDGFAAFSKIIEFSPSIIFLDIMMPRLDGYQVCSVIKSNPEYKNIPVIMLSSKDSVFDKARGKIAGSEHFMTKPFSRDELLKAIQVHATH